ncbi:MAG: peptidyl-prolyl cis-trans isomerase [Deltaproteobacteria bacterium]|nr:peptidyl-prolyl cis-trans isomerase [Deltaproteobacteria bacterium]
MRISTGLVAALVIAGIGVLEAEVSNVKAGSSLTDREEAKKEANPVVIMETSEGTIKIELWADKAPVTVKNFLAYTDEKFYDGTIFHRVINDFMIQGGGFTPDMKQKNTHDPIKNEAAAELKNDRGTLAMARTSVVDSATAQFFINVKDNGFLNHTANTPQGFGYAAFGKVIEGMDVVDKIKGVKTTTSGHFSDVPEKPVIIRSVKRFVKE